MKTSVEIPANELRDVLAFTGAKTKRDAINFAISDFNRRQRLKKLSEKLGTFHKFIDNDELEKLRKS